jgi:hypothetical protein
MLAALVSGIVIGSEISEPLHLGLVIDIGLTALSDGLVFGLVAVITVGLTISFSHQQRNTVTPISAFRTDIAAVFGAGLVSGVVVGLLILVLVGFSFDFNVGLTIAPATGLLVGLGSILWLGLRRCSAWWYGVTVVLLAWRGDIPARALRFLAAAYRRGVLRQAGMMYEFRHNRLAERLSSTPRDH